MTIEYATLYKQVFVPEDEYALGVRALFWLGKSAELQQGQRRNIAPSGSQRQVWLSAIQNPRTTQVDTVGEIKIIESNGHTSDPISVNKDSPTYLFGYLIPGGMSVEAVVVYTPPVGES